LSTTSPPPRVRVSRHVARLVTRHTPPTTSRNQLTSQLQQQPSWLHRRLPRLHQQSAQAATAKSFI
jgi:hypothetical protein